MSATPGTKRIAYYLRDAGNLHYFASLKPYLDRFLREPKVRNFLVVRELPGELDASAELAGYRHLFTDDCDLDGYDLVLTPTHLRDHERTPRMRAVQVFHGMSDKPFTYERDFSGYLCCLLVGRRHLDRLHAHRCNRTMRWTLVGYPKFDAPPTAPRLFDNGRKTLIYCPTWRKGGLSSLESFLAAPEAIEALTRQYNLIVKPHPNTLNPAREFYDSALVRQLERLPGARLIRSGNVMPWFAQADLCIGDVSASGYEWLYFGRPMVFLNPQPRVFAPSRDIEAPTFLWQCGEVCSDMRTLPALVARELMDDRHATLREELLRYSVHEPRAGNATGRGLAAIGALLESR